MILIPPRAGERTKLAEEYRRSLIYQPFFYPDGKGGEVKKDFYFYGWSGPTPAAILPVTEDRKIVAVRQFRHSVNDFVIELPGGLPKHHGQSAESTALRELLEETGFEPKIVWRCGSNLRGNLVLDAKFAPFVGINCRKIQEPSLDKTETMETVIFSPEEWYENIFVGNIIDAQSIAISLLALPFLKQYEIYIP